jgi:hypothetical protein
VIAQPLFGRTATLNTAAYCTPVSSISSDPLWNALTINSSRRAGSLHPGRMKDHPACRARPVPDRGVAEGQGSHSRAVYVANELQDDRSQAHGRRTPKQ